MSGTIAEEVEALLAANSDMTKGEAWARAYRHSEGDRRAELAKSAPNASVSKMEFEVSTEGSVGAIFKADDDFVIWGPASVEVVDKEDDRVKAEALEGALPQLLKRSRLSYEHSDQIVGDILERFETDEPVEVEINGKSYERTEFPTDVLKVDGLEPALFVAGNIYNDTQKSQEVRKQIEEGEVDSYSISGEAVVTEMAVKDGRTFTDILKLDLSAVTLCREGMNQKAKFGVVSKWDGPEADSSLNPQKAASLAKSRINKTMSDNDNDDVQKFVDALDKTLDERLPDGEIATKGDVEEMVEEKIDEKAQEGSPAEGTPERPDGNSDSPTNQSDEYEGDSDDWGQDPTEDSDKVEQTKGADNHPTTTPENYDPEEGRRTDRDDDKSYSKDELKSILPDDQYKAIEPMLDEEGGEQVDPTDERPEEMVEPEMPGEDPLADDEEGEADPVLASKAMENLDVDRLSDEQKTALLKAQSVSKSQSNVRASPSVAGGAQPAHAGADGSDEVAKADGEAVDHDPALRKIYDEEGVPQI